MEEFAKEVVQVNIEGEMKQSYLDYAMSVIVGRALPDVRDGLKPVHRRVLFAMSVLNNEWNRPYKKSARVVGDVIGKYHPHGDTAVYDALVRMAQSFSMRAMLIDGQGNFGSVDGDPPAAMRYTEIRMARIAHELLADLDRETVDFIPNYDESESEPTVFPTRVPNLLVNGSSGIAVGMATNIPPHNLTEVVNACIAYLENPAIDIAGLMEYVPGPDFPTGAIISGGGGIHEAYHTGRGRIYVRAQVTIEEESESSNKAKLIVSELPYQVNKARLLEKIADLAKEKKVEGISELRDESDKDGMRMVIELKRGEMPDVLLNKLYQYTQLQTVFGINMVALVDGQPKLLNLKQIVEAFVRHRREVVTRRTLFDLRKARARAHLLEGLAVALANIDPVIELIKTSANPGEARTRLLERSWPPGSVSEMLSRTGAEATRPEDLEREFGLIDGVYHLSERQTKAILDLQLHRLTGLEQDKILKEFDELLAKIADLLDVLSDPERLRSEIRRELEEIKEQYGDERKTRLLDEAFSFNPEDFITPEDVMVTLSHAGYVKWQPVGDYAAQRRGGKGKTATRMKDEDFIDHLFVANTHDTVLCFSSRGKAYWLKVYQMPQASRIARGKPIVNLLPLEPEERISAILPVADFMQPGFVLMATRSGTIKKTPLKDFSRPRSNGIIAIDLAPEDKLIGAAITDGARDVMLAQSDGKMIRFNETQVRAMGRTARGVRGIRIPSDHWVMSLIIVEEGLVLSATENGYGKCTRIDEFRQQGRGGRGVISIQTSERNGRVVASLLVKPSDEVMLITDGGKLVRTRVSEVSVVGRNTQGVRLITLAAGERLVGLDRLVDDTDEGDEGDEVDDGE
jgi:DNA gyrase subunit A